MSEVTLHLGDALDILPTLPAQSVNAIITDLPYGTTQCKWDTIIPFAPMWEQVKRILKPRGVFVTTACQPFTSALVMSNLEWFKYELIWDKGRGFQPQLANIQPMKAHENILVFAEGGITYNPQKTWTQPDKRKASGRENNRKGGGGHNIFSTINKDNKTYNDRFPVSLFYFDNSLQAEKEHPTQKPVALYKYLILTYTNPGDVVLDFCAGSGTTGVAAIDTGRDCILVERDPEYHAIARRRIAAAQMQPRLEGV